ncbi:MAG: methyltetrahydrofolate cobalamin methyltransferase [Firmicutes bacterium]|nr:methyltetrahydrofolate cobalamin methyltransferase [Bacillota bacterium]
MLIIGERINTSRKRIGEAVAAMDEEFVRRTVSEQVEAGAHMIDVNCGTLIDREPEVLEWLVRIAQDEAKVPLCLDSPNPAALERALAVHQGKPMINSISLEADRYKKILPLLKAHNACVTALCMDDKGMPETAEDGFAVASELARRLMDEGVPGENIFLDPLVRPIGADSRSGKLFLDLTRRIAEELPDVQVICGISNVSYGLPLRKHLNHAFLVMAIAAGLDAVILDPLDKKIMSLAYAAPALVGRDEFCAQYLEAHRAGRLEP